MEKPFITEVPDGLVEAVILDRELSQDFYNRMEAILCPFDEHVESSVTRDVIISLLNYYHINQSLDDVESIIDEHQRAMLCDALDDILRYVSKVFGPEMEHMNLSYYIGQKTKVIVVFEEY